MALYFHKHKKALKSPKSTTRLNTGFRHAGVKSERKPNI